MRSPMNVDLLDFASEDLYFDKPMSPELAKKALGEVSAVVA